MKLLRRTRALPARAPRAIVAVVGLNVVPFALAAWLLLSRAVQPGSLQQTEVFELRQPVVGLQATTDRVGGHLAVTTRDRRLHLFTRQHRRLAEQTLTPPPHMAGLLFADADQDGRDDLWFTPGYEHRADPATVALQLRAGFGQPVPAPEHLVVYPQAVTTLRGPEGTLRVSPSLDGAGSDVRRADGSLVQAVRGLPVASGDLTGAERDSLVTGENEPDGLGVRYRLYLPDGDRLRPAWEVTLSGVAPDPATVACGLASALAAVVELGSAGPAELILADAATGRLFFWRWQSGL